MDIETRARAVKLAIFDVDGVMTDGSLIFGDDGLEYKAFNSLDGHGLKMLKSTGVTLAIITGRRSEVVARRAADVGIEHIYQGAENKLEAYLDLIRKLNLNRDQTAYMGDDVVDLPVLKRCGFSICVPDAPPPVHQNVHYVTERCGGSGAVREVCELIMRAQGTYEPLIRSYLAD